MTEQIVRQDIQGLIDGWMEAERNGEKFPVSFDIAWTIAGYARKDSAKRKLININSGLVKDEDFRLHNLVEPDNHAGLSAQEKAAYAVSEEIFMTCDAFKQFCLMAKTEQGRQIRLYFIDAEKKWKLVQQVSPQFSEEIEALHLKIELAKIEAQKAEAEKAAIVAAKDLEKFRHTITATMPEHLSDKILGCKTVEKIEYRDRIVHNDDLINDGSTILKTDLCYRYGLLTRSGKPDYKKLNTVLEDLPNDAFDLTVRLQDNRELRREWLPYLDRLVDGSERNLHLGE